MPQCDHIAETEPAITGAPMLAAACGNAHEALEDALAAGLSYGFVGRLAKEGSGFDWVCPSGGNAHQDGARGARVGSLYAL